MGNYWTPAENFGNSLLNGEVTKDNAADMTASLNESLNASVATAICMYEVIRQNK